MNDHAPNVLRSEQWVELRDERGMLWARLEVTRCLLEIRHRRHDAVIFNLRDYLIDLEALLRPERSS